ncbi:MAG: DUF1848 family protein [Elusimicrobia bacterium]|nr:DUF1848 family protein [Elusimicrobiota bacterium]
MERYSPDEWGGRVLSLGRLVDVRNFPDVAADALLGKTPAYLGRGCGLPAKRIDPCIVGAVVIWTKGPVDLLVSHPGLREALDVYKRNKAVVGLMVTVTGFGGTFVEPGIAPPEETAAQLRRVLESGLISPKSVVIRYDPILKLRVDDGRLLRNDTEPAIRRVLALFTNLGIARVESKPLLAEEKEGGKYHHVWKRLKRAGLWPEPFSSEEVREIYSRMKSLAEGFGFKPSTCCVEQTCGLKGWNLDAGCIDAEQLTEVGKALFGPDWARISKGKRSSREGCRCSAYWDLSNAKGHKKCGSGEAACLYCTACNEKFSADLWKKVDELKGR